MSNQGHPAGPVADADAATVTGLLAASELRSGDVLAGRFRIASILGVGGMGVVYRAHDEALGVDVAIKLLRPEFARRREAFERFRQELLLARQVSSAHVVRIHDIAQDDGRWFISMDFIDGVSLERRLEGGERLPTDAVIGITRGLLAGLAAAHDRGVVHRDLKPANVLLDRSGQPYISDFGVARSLGTTGLTQSGLIVGTPEYLSPEQARGEAVDARSDLYALGLIVYEMCAGTLPFAGGTPAETVMQRIVRAAPSLRRERPDLPAWLHAFCDRLLRLSPAHRFASAQEALRALDARHVPRAPVNRPLILGLVLLVVAAAGAANWLARHPLRFGGEAAAPVVALPQRVAVLPFTAPGADGALARAFEQHLRDGLREDARVGSIPRDRVDAALARSTPDVSGPIPQRRLDAVAQAANATLLAQGELRRADAGLELVLRLSRADGSQAAKPLALRGADAGAILAAWAEQAPAWLASAGLAAKRPDAPPADALADWGSALQALDRGDPQGAAKAIASWSADTAAASRALRLTAMRVQQNAGQGILAQAARERIVQRYAGDESATGREAYARALLGNGQDEAALAALTRALAAFPNDPRLQLLDAETLIANGGGPQALQLLRRHVAADDKDAHALFLLGRTAIVQGQAQVAVDDYLLRALVLDARSNDEAAEAEVTNALGVGYERLGQLDEAASQYARAAALREKLHDDAGLAKSLRNLAIVQAELGDQAVADRTLDRVRALLEKGNDRASLAELYNSRGVVAEEQGDFAAALKFYRQALAIRRDLKLPDKIAESLNNIGFISYQNGDFDNALAFWRQAGAEYHDLDDRDGVLHIDQSLGLLDIARGRFADARARLESSLQAATDHQLPEETAVGHTYLAELALAEGRLADASAAAQRAQQVFARRQDKRGQIEAGLLRARVALALGQADAADVALEPIAGFEPGAEQKAMWLLVQARRAWLGNDAEGAAAKLEGAAQSAQAAHSGAILTRTRIERTHQALARGDRVRAKEALAALRGETTRLGEVPLRLQWLELEIGAALRAGDDAHAVARYDEALALLRACGRWRWASVLHELGARALRAKPAAAAAAHEAADAARARLLADAPQESRASLQEVLQRRLREDGGDAGH